MRTAVPAGSPSPLVGCSDMSDFGEAKEGLLRAFLRLEHGIPSHDTFSRVFRILDPGSFEAAFRRFMAAFAKANGVSLTGVVAIDGKALRGAYQRGQRNSPLHLVNVWAVQARMALAQQKAPGRNETAGALEVLQLLSLKGCIVTSDALHCHREMATTILDRGGDYVLAIKANRGPLFKAVIQRRAGRDGEGGGAIWQPQRKLARPPPPTPPHKGEGSALSRSDRRDPCSNSSAFPRRRCSRS